MDDKGECSDVSYPAVYASAGRRLVARAKAIPLPMLDHTVTFEGTTGVKKCIDTCGLCRRRVFVVRSSNDVSLSYYDPWRR